MHKRIPWNEKQQAQLKELWNTGMSLKEIGAVFGVSGASVGIKAGRMKLLGRKRLCYKATPDQVAIAQNLYAHGVAISHIAQRLGVTHQTAANWIKDPPKSALADKADA